MDRIERMKDESAVGLGFAGTKTDDYELKVYERRVLVNNSCKTVTITLPPVTEAAGKYYSIICSTYSSSYGVVIADNDDSYSWADDSTSIPSSSGSAGDGALYYSDGFSWWLVATIT